MVNAQVSTLVAVALILAAVCCLARLLFLSILAVYPAFACFLVSQIVTTAVSSLANVRTNKYAWAYLILLAIEWTAYALMIRELYNAIFSRFPGIAILGQWSLYGALLGTVVTIGFGIAAAQEKIAQLGTLLVAVQFASHCLLFGFAAFILILLIAVSRYPLGLHKNIIVNCVLFSLILLGEIAALTTNQGTSWHRTSNLNLAMDIWGVLCLAIWPFLLSREGQTKVIKLRRDYNAEDEAQLLAQLSMVNEILLRVARR